MSKENKHRQTCTCSNCKGTGISLHEQEKQYYGKGQHLIGSPDTHRDRAAVLAADLRRVLVTVIIQSRDFSFWKSILKPCVFESIAAQAIRTNEEVKTGTEFTLNYHAK